MKVSKSIPWFILLLLNTLVAGTFASSDKAEDPKKFTIDETAVLTHAPEVPPAIKRRKPARVKVELETKEVTMRLADGVQYNFWTFGGKVPGPMIRIRQGDYVEFHLHNNQSSKMPHNIDLHAVSGQGGGAGASVTLPGHTSVFSFSALKAGIYIYHCATAPVGMHIANGMYGMILVEPEDGLSKVDKEFYIIQSDFYTKGSFGKKGLQPFDMEKAIKEQADYVVFNGSVGALTGDNALKANVGETVRIFFGVGGPNLTSSFHVIGEIFDKVYPEGGTKLFQENVQTTVVPPGGATMVEFKVDVPATYVLVDHAIFRAFNKGALGLLKVDGPEVPNIYSGKQADEVNLPEGGAIQSMPGQKEIVIKETKNNLKDRMAAGKIKFEENCLACHQASGEGVRGVFPPLAKSDYLMANKKRAIQVVLKGLEGKIVVNGQEFNNIMPVLDLSDEVIANILTYVRNSWGNKSDMVTPEEVAKQRK